MQSPAPIHIGTSGWHYRHWQGCFYPPEIPASGWLKYYATHFHTSEINASFYRLPDEHVLSLWRDATPDDFVFSVKASRYITHMKKLKEPHLTLPPFLEGVSFLGNKLGPLLFQLPPNWHLNPERLEFFLEAMDRKQRCVFEFRDPAWFDDRVYSILQAHRAAFCIFDLNRKLSPVEVTTDFAYVRLHGPEGPYCGSYDARTLGAWAERIAGWRAMGKQVYCYFDNDQAGHAPQNAMTLQGLLGLTTA